MSKIEDSFQVGVGYDDVVKIVKDVIVPYGGIEKDGGFEVKGSLTLVEWPVTVLIRLERAGEGSTSVKLFAKNFGFGPIQKKACKNRVEEVRYAISNACSNFAAGSEDGVTEL